MKQSTEQKAQGIELMLPTGHMLHQMRIWRVHPLGTSWYHTQADPLKTISAGPVM